MSNFFSKDNSEGQNLFSANNSGEEDFFAEFSEKPKEEVRENSLDRQYNEIKLNYEQIFIEAAESIRKDLDTLKPENPCEGCSHKDCKIEKKDIFAPYPPSGCKLREWQMQALTYLNGDYKHKLKSAHKALMDKKENYECNKCAACCMLAVSQYSYEQLKQRAMKGDKYSAGFVSVFVPYDSEEEAKEVNPEYFELLNRLVEDDKIYYYYCPKLKNNLCSIYEERPQICRDFPHNPLKLLPSQCSFNEWKNEISHQAMLINAKTDIIEYYKKRLG